MYTYRIGYIVAIFSEYVGVNHVKINTKVHKLGSYESQQISNNYYYYNPRLFTSLYVQCAKVKLVLQTHAQLLQGKVSHNLQGSILDLHSVLILCLLCSLHFDNIKLHNLTKGMYIYCSLS